MKKFEGNRPLADIEFHCKRKKWNYDQTKYNEGSDWVSFDFHHAGHIYPVLLNGFNGRFMVKLGDEIITESSKNMDGTPWYDALLDFVYLPLNEAA